MQVRRDSVSGDAAKQISSCILPLCIMRQSFLYSYITSLDRLNVRMRHESLPIRDTKQNAWILCLLLFLPLRSPCYDHHLSGTMEHLPWLYHRSERRNSSAAFRILQQQAKRFCKSAASSKPRRCNDARCADPNFATKKTGRTYDFRESTVSTVHKTLNSSLYSIIPDKFPNGY